MTITLLDGRTEDTNNILFDVNTYHFHDGATGEDLTAQIKFQDKLTFTGFDGPTWLTMVSDINRFGSVQPTLDTGLWSNFFHQLSTDALGAPLDALNKGVNRVFSAPATLKIGLAVLVIVVIYVVVKRKA